MPLLVTFEASDLNKGSTGPTCLLLATFCTVSTTTDDVSCAPLSARSSPGKSQQRLAKILNKSGEGKHEDGKDMIKMETQGVHRVLCRRWTERTEYVESMEEREQHEEVRWGKDTVEKMKSGIGWNGHASRKDRLRQCAIKEYRDNKHVGSRTLGEGERYDTCPLRLCLSKIHKHSNRRTFEIEG